MLEHTLQSQIFLLVGLAAWRASPITGATSSEAHELHVWLVQKDYMFKRPKTKMFSFHHLTCYPNTPLHV